MPMPPQLTLHVVLMYYIHLKPVIVSQSVETKEDTSLYRKGKGVRSKRNPQRDPICLSLRGVLRPVLTFPGRSVYARLRSQEPTPRLGLRVQPLNMNPSRTLLAILVNLTLNEGNLI